MFHLGAPRKQLKWIADLPYSELPRSAAVAVVTDPAQLGNPELISVRKAGTVACNDVEPGGSS